MFNELEIWMKELEEELLTDYLNAHRALNNWKEAKRSKDKSIALYDIQDKLKGNYLGYWSYTISSNYREEEIELDGTTWIVLLESIQIDDHMYDLPTIVVRPKNDVQGHRKASDDYRIEEQIMNMINNESGMNKFFTRRHVYPADVTLVTGRDEKWIAARAHKDMIRHKEAIENKITKICEKIALIEEVDDEYYIIGTNGKKAHLWRVIAGGYNIQRLHTRCLCKECKN